MIFPVKLNIIHFKASPFLKTKETIIWFSRLFCLYTFLELIRYITE